MIPRYETDATTNLLLFLQKQNLATAIYLFGLGTLLITRYEKHHKEWKMCSRYEKCAQGMKNVPRVWNKSLMVWTCFYRYETGVFLKNSGFSYLYGSISFLFGSEKNRCFFLMRGKLMSSLLCVDVLWKLLNDDVGCQELERRQVQVREDGSAGSLLQLLLDVFQVVRADVRRV